MIIATCTRYTCGGYGRGMVNRNIVENAIAAIQQNVRELQNAVDIDWNIYASDIRSRRFIERTLHVIIEACIEKVDDEIVYGIFKNNLHDIERFIGYVLKYIEKA